MIDHKDSSLIKTALTDMIRVVTALKQSGHAELAHALKEITERVAGSDGLRRTRHEIIQNLVFIGEQAALPPEQRNQGLLKAALNYAKNGIELLGTLPEAWHTFGQPIEEFFNL